jgi:hypothetical protein
MRHLEYHLGPVLATIGMALYLVIFLFVLLMVLYGLGLLTLR